MIRSGRLPVSLCKGANIMRKLGTALVALTAASLPVAALATPADPYSAITDAVDWATAITAIGAVAALLAAVLVIRKGVRFVLGMIK